MSKCAYCGTEAMCVPAMNYCCSTHCEDLLEARQELEAAKAAHAHWRQEAEREKARADRAERQFSDSTVALVREVQEDTEEKTVSAIVAWLRALAWNWSEAEDTKEEWIACTRANAEALENGEWRKKGGDER